MKQAVNSATHYLFDPISGEGSMSFTPSADRLSVTVRHSAHPDLPDEVSTCSVEEARERYRRAIKAGYVAA